MGKKRITEKTSGELSKEAKDKDVKKESITVSSFSDKGISRGRAYIHVSYNNTIITLTDTEGKVIAWASAGSAGFKGARKSTPFAASRVTEILTEKIKKIGIKDIEVFVRGIGSGRDSAIRSLASRGLNIISIEDVTPLPHNGCRPRKARRV